MIILMEMMEMRAKVVMVMVMVMGNIQQNKKVSALIVVSVEVT